MNNGKKKAWLLPKNWVLKNCFKDSPCFIGEFWRENAKKSASLTLSRYIVKSIKRWDTHNSDSHRRYLSSDVIHFLWSFELIPREVFKVGEVSEMLCCSCHRSHTGLGGVKTRRNKIKHSRNLCARINFIQPVWTRRIMEAMHGYKKCEIIWNFPKVTKAVIVSNVGERNVQEY